MQLNKVLKSLLIALPVLAVTACSSSDDAANSGSQTNQSAVSTVDSNGLNAQGQLTEQELKEQALRENQTIYFAFDNATIASDYEAMLAAHAAYLVKTKPTRNYRRSR